MQNTGAAAVASLADNGAGDRSRSSKPHRNQKLKELEIDMCSVKQFLACRGFRVRHDFSTAHSFVVVAEHSQTSL